MITSVDKEKAFAGDTTWRMQGMWAQMMDNNHDRGLRLVFLNGTPKDPM